MSNLTEITNRAMPEGGMIKKIFWFFLLMRGWLRGPIFEDDCPKPDRELKLWQKYVILIVVALVIYGLAILLIGFNNNAGQILVD